MNDSAGNTTAPCLAVAEKRSHSHKPGGCGGVFFQLFDWNRRFAKKKFFSRKLLPSAAAKQASNSCKGDEKILASKLQLITDEKSGEPPSKKNSKNMDSKHKHEMRTPGLVARLMGLEALPAACENAYKASNCDAYEDRNFSDNCCRFEREDVNMEMGSTKLDSWPQKLQKTGQSERKAVTKFRSEAFQIRSVLSRSRKHYHQTKLVSPISSPKIHSAKNVSRTSRLIGVATKILEPGLQSTNKAKSALTFSRSVLYPSSKEVIADGMVANVEHSKQNGYSSNAAGLMGHTCCQNCGNVLDVKFIANAAEESPVFQPSTPSFIDGLCSEGTGRSKARKPVSYHGQETDVPSLRTWGHQRSSTVQRKEKMGITQSTSKPITEWKSLPSEGLGSRKLPCQPCRPHNDEPSSVSLKPRSIMLDQMPLRRARIPPAATVKSFQSRRVSSASNVVKESKDFVALNRSLSSRTIPRTPSKMENSKFSHERKATNEQLESLPHLRSSASKRRTANVSSQVETGKGAASTSMKERNVCSDTQTCKGLGPNAHSLNRTCSRSTLVGHQDGNRASESNDSSVKSFPFNVPSRHKTGGLLEMDKKIIDNGLKKYFQTPFSLEADSMGALLMQKLKELTSQEDYELTADIAPKRSTAMILQELISALTAEQPDMASPSMVEKRKVNLTKVSHKDHLSPGSVLEASFSSRSSLDDSSGHRMCPRSLEYTGDQLQLLQRDSDPSDCASSLDKVGTGNEMVTALLSNISKILHCIKFAAGRLTESTLQAKYVILNAELLFRSMTMQNMDGTILVISPIFHELETIANAIWQNINVFNYLEATKMENHFVGFIFDSMVECLDLQYGQYCNIGFNAWRRMHLCMTRETMIGLIAEDINKWTYLVGMTIDEIIEWEMSQSRFTWTDFDVEAFETGAGIGGDILQILVHEVVLDLLECRWDCF